MVLQFVSNRSITEQLTQKPIYVLSKTGSKLGEEIESAIEALTNSIQAAGYMFTTPPNESTSRQTFLPLKLRTQIWQTTQSPIDKRKFNKAAKNQNSRLWEIKNEATAEYLRNLDPNTNYLYYSLWKATKYLKSPTRRDTIGIVFISFKKNVTCTGRT